MKLLNFEGVSGTINPVSNPINTQRKGKDTKRKGNDNKTNDNKLFNFVRLVFTNNKAKRACQYLFNKSMVIPTISLKKITKQILRITVLEKCLTKFKYGMSSIKIVVKTRNIIGKMNANFS